MKVEEKALTWTDGAEVSAAVDVPMAIFDSASVFFSRALIGDTTLTLQASRDEFTTAYDVWKIDIDTARKVAILPTEAGVVDRAVDLTPVINGLQGQQVRLDAGCSRSAISGYWEFVHKD